MHPLRVAGALQLAAVIELSAGEPQTIDVVCFDDRLVSAALREGFTVIEAE